jgi:hypothetical protein
VLTAFLCVGVAARTTCGEEQRKKKDMRVYTDEDLRRVSPLRDQTGGSMERAPSPPAEKSSGGGPTGHGEAYWRREAERLRERLQPLRERMAEMHAQMEERRRKPGVRPYSDPGIESLQRRIIGLEERIREAEDRLHERARRDGAMPGWLR